MACTKMSLTAVVLFCAVCLSQGKVEQAEDGMSGKISFSTPDLNDEEQHSMFMPDQLKCDACRAIAYQLWDAFDKLNKKKKHYKFNLPESEILDVTEKVCSTKTYDAYGLKEVKKENRLSGPGLETADTPGVLQGGGKWPGRMVDMCETFMGEVGEEEVYEGYKVKPKSKKQFEKFLCYGEDLLGLCSGGKAKKDEL